MSVEILIDFQFIRNVTIGIIVIMISYTAINCFRKTFQLLSVQYNFLCRLKYWNLFSVDLVVSNNDVQYILHSSDIRKKKSTA